MKAASISRLTRVPVEICGAYFLILSAASGAPGSLQPSSQGLLGPLMSGSPTRIVFGAWLAGSHRELQTIVVDSYEFFVCS